MTIASDFTRDDCQLGRKRVTYPAIQREYRCNACGGRIVIKSNLEEVTYKLLLHPECGRCGGRDFIHERELQCQRSEAIEVLDGLPMELAAILE